MVGRTPWSAADAPVGLPAPSWIPIALFRLRDAGVPRGPGGPPHHGHRSAALCSPPPGEQVEASLPAGLDQGGHTGAPLEELLQQPVQRVFFAFDPIWRD